MIQWILIPVLGFLDRLGGGGFGWLGAQGWLAQGHKWARRYGIPVVIWFLRRTPEQAILCGIMAFAFSSKLDEITERKWDTVAMYGLTLAYTLYPLAGYWSLVVPAWWILGVFWSNIGIRGNKIGWHYVELLRGAFIGLALALGG